MPRSVHPLDRTSIETYLFFIIAIVMGVRPMTALLRGGLFLLAAALMADVVRRSSWTIKWKTRSKIALFAVILLALAAIFWIGVQPALAPFSFSDQMPPQRSTIRSATTSGPDSPANTGDNNSFRYGDQKQDQKKQQTQKRKESP